MLNLTLCAIEDTNLQCFYCVSIRYVKYNLQLLSMLLLCATVQPNTEISRLNIWHS
jgi:hypothetical protein